MKLSMKVPQFKKSIASKAFDSSKTVSDLEKDMYEVNKKMKPKLKKAVEVPHIVSKNIQGKPGTAKGIHFDSIWEYAFYTYMTLIEQRYVVRNFDKYFEYTNANGENARFYPDFDVSGLGYCEVKGIYRENDIRKRDQTYGLVKFYDGHQIKPMIARLSNEHPGWNKDYKLDVFKHRDKFKNMKAY